MVSAAPAGLTPALIGVLAALSADRLCEHCVSAAWAAVPEDVDFHRVLYSLGQITGAMIKTLHGAPADAPVTFLIHNGTHEIPVDQAAPGARAVGRWVTAAFIGDYDTADAVYCSIPWDTDRGAAFLLDVQQVFRNATRAFLASGRRLDPATLGTGS